MEKPKFNLVNRNKIPRVFTEYTINTCLWVLSEKAVFDQDFNVIDFKYSVSRTELGCLLSILHLFNKKYIKSKPPG